MSARSTAVLLLVAILCIAGVFALGALVAGRTPMRLDIEATALRGTATPLALIFTGLGRWWSLAPIALALALAARSAHLSLAPIAALVGGQLLSQGAVAAIKLLFHRSRPDAWLAIRETDWSFPSGHATTAMVFYGAIVVLLWRAGLFHRPLAAIIALACVVLAIGLPWSRVALGAHYATDVLAGLLFGVGWLCATFAVCARWWPAGITLVPAVANR